MIDTSKQDDNYKLKNEEAHIVKPVKLDEETSYDFEIKEDDIVIVEANLDNAEFSLKIHL